MGNNLIFKIPKPSYHALTYPSRCSYIELYEEFVESEQTLTCACKLKQISTKIPYLFFKKSSIYKKRQLFIYFHANSEDLGLCYPLLEEMHEKLEVDVFAIEYPGFGIYKGDTTEGQIYKDALSAFEYIRFNMKKDYQPEDIILIGRSLGSGPAIFLASLNERLGGLILISAFCSIKQVTQEQVGILLAQLTPNIFQNDKVISDVKCPLLIIHGQNDHLSSISQAESLYQICQSETKELLIRPDMKHNTFKFNEDFKEPVQKFLEKTNKNKGNNSTPKTQISLQEYFKTQYEL